MNQTQAFEQGLAALGFPLDASVRQKHLDYLAVLQKWNRVHNLTAVRNPDDMVTLHLLDSLSVLPYIESGRLLDVGSGAGLPGIPIALARPDLQVTVLDSNHKKASFMRQAKAELGIDNLEIICGRVEQFHPSQPFQQIISRAFSDLAEFLRLTRHLLAENGRWLAMKGVYPYDEIAQLAGVAAEVHALVVPGLAAQRHLVVFRTATT